MKQTPTTERPLLSCSFCGKRVDEVKKLVAGPTVYICDGCVSLCNDIVQAEIGEDDEAKAPREQKPIDSLKFASFLAIYLADHLASGPLGAPFAAQARGLADALKVASDEKK